MRVLSISDKVVPQLYEQDPRPIVGPVDLILSCGDVPFYYVDYLATTLQVPFYFVHGNHPMGANVTWPGRRPIPQGANVHARVVNYRGLLIAGLEGSRRYRPGAPFQYTEWEMGLHCAKLIPRLLWNRLVYGRYVDVLITHAPPRHIHDAEDRAHQGFVCFRWFMRLFRPRVLIHGHKHVYRQDEPRVTRFHQTTVINTYPYRVWDLEEVTGAAVGQTAPIPWRDFSAGSRREQAISDQSIREVTQE
ncbi:MAG: metallophosphoesterase [Chloroflexi bacterium]|nr:metallophosphoesterase [Chloroflexota bacterium]